MIRKLSATLLAALLFGCGAHEFTPTPAVPTIPDSMFYQQIDLSVGIWEEIGTDPESLSIGGTPTYIDPLKSALDDAKLFREVTVSPWRPTGQFDVLLKISDVPRIDLHRKATLWKIRLAPPFVRFDADVDSALRLESVESAGEPLLIQVHQNSHLSGKFLAFYGKGDERLTLAKRHSRVLAGRLTAELIGRRKWFEQIAAAKKKGGEDPAPAGE